MGKQEKVHGIKFGFSKSGYLTVEAVDLGDLPGLVVAAQEGDPVGVLCLQREEAGEGLEGEVAAVDKVPEEDVVGVRDLAAGAEELLEVVELAVDVSAHRHRRRDRLHVGLLQEDVADDVAEFLE